jgi:hypothetical protein
MLEVFAGKVRKTGSFQKSGLPGNSDRSLGTYYKSESVSQPALLWRDPLDRCPERTHLEIQDVRITHRSSEEFVRLFLMSEW